MHADKHRTILEEDAPSASALLDENASVWANKFRRIDAAGIEAMARGYLLKFAHLNARHYAEAR